MPRYTERVSYSCLSVAICNGFANFFNLLTCQCRRIVFFSKFAFKVFESYLPHAISDIILPSSNKQMPRIATSFIVTFVTYIISLWNWTMAQLISHSMSQIMLSIDDNLTVTVPAKRHLPFPTFIRLCLFYAQPKSGVALNLPKPPFTRCSSLSLINVKLTGDMPPVLHFDYLAIVPVLVSIR